MPRRLRFASLSVMTNARTAPSSSLRIAGIGMLVAGLGFLPQPLLIFLLPAPDGSEFWPADRLGELYLRTTIQAATWGVFGAALLVSVVAVASLAGTGVWARVGAVFGLIAGAAWLAESAWRLAPRAGGIIDHLPDSGASDETQGAVLYLWNLVGFGWTALGGIAVGVWFLMLATSRESPIRSRTLRVISGIVGAAQVPLTYALPYPAAGFAVFVLLVVLGIAVLAGARRGLHRSSPGAAAASLTGG